MTPSTTKGERRIIREENDPALKEKRYARMRRRHTIRKRHGNVQKRVCSATTILGHPCTAGRAIITYKGKDYLSLWCFAHIPNRLREKWGVGQWGNKKDNAYGRNRPPNANQILKEMVENEIAEWLKPYLEALSAEKPVVVGTGPHAHIEMVADVRARQAAADSVMDRVYGKPKQTTELTGAEGGPIAVDVPVDKDRELEVARILADNGAVRGIDDKTVAAALVSRAQAPVNQN